MINFLNFLALAASVGLSFGVVPSNIYVGGQFKVPINVSSAGLNTLGTDVVLKYDSNMLEVNKIVGGKVYPSYPESLEDIDNVMGKSRFTGTVGFDTPKPAEGTLGWVYFSAKKPGTTTISFAFEPGKTDDSNIVPDGLELDLLKDAPENVTVQIKEATGQEKIWALLTKIFSFDYLNF